jgi:hypothetical protein
MDDEAIQDMRSVTKENEGKCINNSSVQKFPVTPFLLWERTILVKPSDCVKDTILREVVASMASSEESFRLAVRGTR